MSDTDLELLARYTRQHSSRRNPMEADAEDAFAEIVRRHVGLVYAAALRQVRSPQLAEEVAQSAFTDLARAAARLHPDTVLAAWLYQVTRRTAIDVVRREASRRLREHVATEMNAMHAPAADLSRRNPMEADWTHIEPLLDEAMDTLDENDRAAVLLRYFENKSLREVGQALGASENAAQKRLRRAVDRLREFLAKHGVTVGASGLVAALSTHAVQAAPMGLALAISTAAPLAAVPLTTATLTTLTMTTLQKTLVALALAGAVGTGLHQARRAANLRDQIQTLRAQLTEQGRQAQRERDETEAGRLILQGENERLKSAATEVLKLRDEVTQLRSREAEWARNRALNQRPPADPAPPPRDNELPRNSWADAGFATPQDALRTRGWSVLNGHRDRFKESVRITEGARSALEDMLVRMAEASNAPDKARFIQEIADHKFGVEEGILMPLMAENSKKGYAGYRILSQQSPSADEALLEVETQMTSAPVKRETMKFRRFGSDWKVLIDEDFIKSMH